MITLQNVTVQRSGRTIFKDVSANIKEGDIIILVGPNGAGKSTFLELIAGTIKPAQGTVLIDGQDVSNLNERQRAPFIARLCQNPSLNVVNEMSVAENLLLSHLKCRNARLKIARHTDSLVDSTMQSILGNRTKELLQLPAQALSGGQRQTLAFVMATVKQPKVLLLDEPTSALDPKAAVAMLEGALGYIHKHRITTVMITHDINIAKQIGDKLWVLSDGSLRIIDKNTSELSSDSILRIISGLAN